MSIATEALVTADELYALPDDGLRRELVEGEVIAMAPAGGEHGVSAMRLGSALQVWADQHEGLVYAAETGFRVSRDPDTVLAPDAAFTQAARGSEIPAGFVELVPDLVVEVVSPNDRTSEVLGKVGRWLEVGVRVVWLVWPQRRQVQVWHEPTQAVTLGVDDTLTEPDLLPGFELPLRRLFPLA